jgi:HSP20 family protein
VDRERPEKYVGFRRFQTEVDRMFLEFMGPERMFGRAHTAFRPNMDVYFSKAENAMIVKLELAGIDPDTIHLETEDHTLHVRGHRVDMRPQDKVYQQMEIAYGPFERRVHLPVEIEAARATAHYRSGFLEIVLPIADKPESKRIPINIKDKTDDGPDATQPEVDPREA